MKRLTVGHKVRIKESGASAQIINVIDENTAKIETFDGIIQVKSTEVKVFEANDKDWSSSEELYFEHQKTVQSKQEKKISFNERKNQFSYELDLHAEALIPNHESKSEEEILTIQISRAKNYVQQAIDFRAQRVYIIHGVGSGRLQSEVNQMLRKIKEVKEAINEYHPRYGMGVTEVRLK